MRTDGGNRANPGPNMVLLVEKGLPPSLAISRFERENKSKRGGTAKQMALLHCFYSDFLLYSCSATQYSFAAMRYYYSIKCPECSRRSPRNREPNVICTTPIALAARRARPSHRFKNSWQIFGPSGNKVGLVQRYFLRNRVR